MTRTSSFGFKFVIKLARLTSHACQLTNKLGLLLGTRKGKEAYHVHYVGRECLKSYLFLHITYFSEKFELNRFN